MNFVKFYEIRLSYEKVLNHKVDFQVKYKLHSASIYSINNNDDDNNNRNLKQIVAIEILFYKI